MNGRPWTAEHDAALRRMIRAGLGDAEIGAKMGRDRDVIGRHRRAQGLQPGVSPLHTMMMARINARRFRLQFQSRSFA